MAHTICTFNANNLYARYRFSSVYPGDRTGRSRAGEEWGYLPLYQAGCIELFNPEQRALSAMALTGNGNSYPDVICMQEVESLLSLRMFNREHLEGQYPYAVLIDSYDFRQIDVGVLSRLPILNVRTHVDEKQQYPHDPKRPWLFSRDCLEVEVDLGKPGSLTLFINHFKSKYAETPAQRDRADKLRTHQAERVSAIVHERFPGNAYDSALFAVVGDLNDEPASDPVKAIVKDAGLFDAMERIQPEADRWTHYYKWGGNIVSQLDYLLLSPALAAATQNTPPRIENKGIGFAYRLADGNTGPRRAHFHKVDDDQNPVDVPFQFPRFDDVTPRNCASDHCPVFFDVP